MVVRGTRSTLIYVFNSYPFRTGSGFKVRVSNLATLRINLGKHTSAPGALIGVSTDGSPFRCLSVRVGSNDIPLESTAGVESSVVVDILVLSFAVTNRMHLGSLVLNSVC